MGLLDDAIREHLELKRRRGADPTEVARAEQEALGPVRREPEPASLQEPLQEEPLTHEHDDAAYADYPEQGPAHDDAAAHELPPEEQTRILLPEENEREPAPHADQPPHADQRPPADQPPHADPPPTHEPRTQSHEPHPHPEPPPHAEPRVHEQPEAETTSPPHGDPAHDEPVDPRHSDVVNQPTTEWRIEDEDEPFAPEQGAADESGRSDEDVLEETPDFLQETPEHDRLWFEQRPPRDFDFDD